ncbi:inositol monophosphatase [Melanomma pulvis-pyrius CBS 109.77]|uniref:Inositol-1-monophosphatase n=1 Tax=Melanomma pulvis-pyrius CBS 109.77 TaxID=1314802 RepID=A0A6A6XW41_9PLEO|nr:inositol monophosphatase [Melanomma pulvis-pyrius CBS 109.77]
MTEHTLTQVRNVLVSLAYEAGRVMMVMGPDPSVYNESDTKKNSSDRVTDADRAIECMVASDLRNRFPGISFLGEETTEAAQKLTSAPTFVCDPIDGTLNFIHGFPNIAVSLALTIDKRPVVGVVYNPFRNELYTAIKGQGAWLTLPDGNQERLPLRPIPAPMASLGGCLVALEWGSERQGPNWELRTDMAKTLMSSKATGGAMVHSIRSSGSAALDFCYVAAGQIDMFWEGGCWIWDVCAGWIILEEAGGVVVSANPNDWNPELESRCYLAVRGAKMREQEAVVKELWGLMGDRKFVF